MDVLATLRTALSGRYDVEQELGHGGMAVVYGARDLKHGRRVAIKVLKPDLAQAVGTERFLREIEIEAQLQHPHILPLLDSDQAAGLPFYVMPLVEGESLREHLDQEGRLSQDEAFRITSEVADALSYAHGHGVVHRDIKPENILLSNGHALVADFGIARALTAAGTARLTDSGLAIGTPQYMSPEQAGGDPRLDARSDIYSLGCVLYEMLAGEPPFSGATAEAVMRRQMLDAPPRLDVVRPDLPRHVVAAVETALHKVPSERFRTAIAFREALARAEVETPTRTRVARWAAIVAVVVGIAVVAVVLYRNVVAAPPHFPNLHAVLPFRHSDGAAPPPLTGDQCEYLVRSALGRWDDAVLVNALEVSDILARRGRPHSVTEALEAARSLRAGFLVWGDVRESMGRTVIQAAIYDVSQRGALREHSLVLEPVQLEDPEALGTAFNGLIDSLLGAAATSDVPGARMTSSLRALRAYEAGLAGERDRDFGAAAAEFARAGAADPDFAQAHYRHAQVLSWSGAPRAEWRMPAQRAVQLVDLLSSDDRRLARALLALAEGRAQDACRDYRATIAGDSTNFTAWYGLGECLRADRAVTRDGTSPSGYRFRSSYEEAIRAYRNALRLVPSFPSAFRESAFRLLTEAFPISSNWTKVGYGEGDDEGLYPAYPGLRFDTIVLYPFPMVVFQRAEGVLPPTNRAALERNLAVLDTVVTEGAAAFPNSPEAREVEAQLLEARGRIEGAGRSAIGSARAALRTARTLADSARVGVLLARLTLKTHAYEAARRMADSLLRANPAPDPSVAVRLRGLPGLTGRAHTAAELAVQALPRSAPDPLSPSESQWRAGIAPPLAEAEQRFLAYAAMGGPVDTLRILAARIDSLVDVYEGIATARRDTVKLWLTATAAGLAYPVLGALPVHDVGLQVGLGELRRQRLHALGDTSGLRAELERIRRIRAPLRPGDTAIHGAYHEAWLWLALGDTSRAVERLDGSLNALPTLAQELLDEPQFSAGLVRAMALRAEVAAARRDAATARRWAERVAILWENADAELQPFVERMRRIAARGTPD